MVATSPNDPETSGIDDERTVELEAAEATPPRSVETLPTRTLGPYVIGERLGSGGMGVVYEAYDPRLHRRVALKLLLPTGHVHEARARLLREAQALARLAHPNVVPVFDVGTVDDRVYMAMELIDGETIDRWCKRHPRSVAEILAVFRQAGQGLAAAHEAGFTHRDFKPQNVLIDHHGSVRVVDFGLARGTGRGARFTEEWSDERRSITVSGSGGGDQLERALTENGMVVGTPAYMAPEQFRGLRASPASDQFSFCVALWEAIYGCRPFGRGLLKSMSLSDATPRKPEVASNVRIPDRLRRALLRGLDPEPERRHPSMQALLTALDESTRRRASLPLWFGTVTLAGAGLSWLLAMQTDRPSNCSSGRERIDATWNEARKAEIREALLRNDAAFAGRAWERVQSRIDTYVERWNATHERACEAASLRTVDPLVDARMQCLERRRVELDVTLGLLLEADDEALATAVRRAASLEPVEHCDDVEPWRPAVERPSDPLLAARVDDLRARLDRAHARIAAGGGDVLAEIEGLAAEAEALGYEPLRAEALLELGRTQRLVGQARPAERSLSEAVWTAKSGSHDVVAAEAAIMLIAVLGLDLGRPREALEWERHAAAVFGDDPSALGLQGASMRADLELHAGLAEMALGNNERALARIERAIEMERELRGPDHPEVAQVVSQAGIVLTRMGRVPEALQRIEESWSVLREALGDDHPDVIRALASLGTAHAMLGHNDRATPLFREALERFERSVSTRHVFVADMESNLGLQASSAGKPTEALEHHERALALLTELLGPDNMRVGLCELDIGATLSDLGRGAEALVHQQRGLLTIEATLGPDHEYTAAAHHFVGMSFYELDQYPAAREHFERALAIRTAQHGDNDHPDMAETYLALGGVLSTLDDTRGAEQMFARAVPIFERTLGPHASRTLRTRMHLAVAHLQQDRLPHAQAELEAVLAHIDADVDPLLRAEAELGLAMVLRERRAERDRARRLAESAAATFMTAGPAYAGELADARRLLQSR